MMKISSFNAPISANKVSIFKLAIEEWFKDYFRLIQAKSLALAMIKSVTFFMGHPVANLLDRASKVVCVPFLPSFYHISCRFYWELFNILNMHLLNTDHVFPLE